MKKIEFDDYLKTIQKKVRDGNHLAKLGTFTNDEMIEELEGRGIFLNKKKYYISNQDKITNDEFIKMNDTPLELLSCASERHPAGQLRWYVQFQELILNEEP